MLIATSVPGAASIPAFGQISVLNNRVRIQTYLADCGWGECGAQADIGSTSSSLVDFSKRDICPGKRR